MSRQRSPGFKLLMTGLIGLALCIPLLAVYALVYDREQQSQTAQGAITAGWGGPQVVAGPVLVVPYRAERTENESVNGRVSTRTVTVRELLYVSPERQSVRTRLDPERRSKSIYSSVTYLAELAGEARFRLPADLERYGVERAALLLDEAEIRFGVSDPRGLQAAAEVRVGGEDTALQPGRGLLATSGSGFFGFVDWSGAEPLDVQWAYKLRGSQALSLVPRGGETRWQVESAWAHPSFAGSFLPDTREVGDDGFEAAYSVSNLALGRELVTTADDGPPIMNGASADGMMIPGPAVEGARGGGGGPSMAASVALVDPVDLYSQVDRSVKYGFLFIGFTFLAFFMFDVVGGARVAAAEYLLTGAGLVLFFVLLLAFAELVGITAAYLIASVAIIGLLTAYSAAVLGTWRRAGFIGAMLAGLYALLFVLLNLETWSLVIGSLLLFAALAGVMYATRRIDWSSVGRGDEVEV